MKNIPLYSLYIPIISGRPWEYWPNSRDYYYIWIIPIKYPIIKMDIIPFDLQGGAPPVMSWFIIPLTIDVSPINYSYWTYKLI